MKLVHPEILSHIELTDGTVSSVIVENQKFYYELIKELKAQCDGSDGKWVMSDKDVPVAVSKNVELITDFIDFEVNKKTLITKMIAAFEKTSLEIDHVDKTMSLLAEIERYITEIGEEYDVDFYLEKLSFQQILKSVGLTVIIDGDELSENIYSYMKLVREFLGDRLFIFVNLRSYIDDEVMEAFSETVIRHGYKVLLFENKAYALLNNENRLIIDKDLCEI